MWKLLYFICISSVFIFWCNVILKILFLSLFITVDVNEINRLSLSRRSRPLCWLTRGSASHSRCGGCGGGGCGAVPQRWRQKSCVLLLLSQLFLQCGICGVWMGLTGSAGTHGAGAAGILPARWTCLCVWECVSVSTLWHVSACLTPTPASSCPTDRRPPDSPPRRQPRPAPLSRRRRSGHGAEEEEGWGRRLEESLCRGSEHFTDFVNFSCSTSEASILEPVSISRIINRSKSQFGIF